VRQHRKRQCQRDWECAKQRRPNGGAPVGAKRHPAFCRERHEQHRSNEHQWQPHVDRNLRAQAAEARGRQPESRDPVEARDVERQGCTSRSYQLRKEA